MESVKCEIRLLFIRQRSAKEKEAVRCRIKQGEHTSLIYSVALWHLVKNDNNSLNNDNESNESLDTELFTRAQREAELNLCSQTSRAMEREKLAMVLRDARKASLRAVFLTQTVCMQQKEQTLRGIQEPFSGTSGILHFKKGSYHHSGIFSRGWGRRRSLTQWKIS